MASPALDLEDIATRPQESPPDAACREAQKWIEQVTGRSFGDKDFRTGLENGILLCELLNAIKPGLIKKINRLPTPIAGLDNITLFLRGCKELGLKESQLFDPGDLQDNSNRTTVRLSDCNRKLRNVLVTVYWLGKAANGCASYSGNDLDLKEFEGLLAQMRKENEEIESPKRNIRDSGYIDCWDSERSDSLSPPRHGRDDSFDSLDSFGSRSQQTPSPDVILRGSSDGRGSDSESDLPNRRLPDVRKDDMSARRVSFGENKIIVPFNQYLPNKSNQTSYIPAPLRKKKAEREDYRKSWSTATSPLGGERPFSPIRSETIEEELSEGHSEEDGTTIVAPLKGFLGKANKLKEQFEQKEEDTKDQSDPSDIEVRKLKSLEKVGIKVMPAAKRYSSQKQSLEDYEPDLVLQKENSNPLNVDSEEEEEYRVPDIERDDLATRRARMNQPKMSTPFNQYIHGSYINKSKPPQDDCLPSTPASPKHNLHKSKPESQGQTIDLAAVSLKGNVVQRPVDVESDQEEEKIPDVQRDDLAKRKTHGVATHQKEPKVFGTASITKADLETWQRLKLSSEDSENTPVQSQVNSQSPNIDLARAANDDFGKRKLSLQEKRARNKQKFVRFGPVTEIDQQKWDRLCIAKPTASEGNARDEQVPEITCAKAVLSDISKIEVLGTIPLQYSPRPAKPEVCRLPDVSAPPENEADGQVIDTKRDDMLARRMGTFQKCARISNASPAPDDSHRCIDHGKASEQMMEMNGHRQPLQEDNQHVRSKVPPCNVGKPDCADSCNNPDAEHPASVEDTCKVDRNLQKDRSTPDPEKDDMMVRRISVSQKPPIVALSHFLPVPFSAQQKVEEEKNICSQAENKQLSSIQAVTILLPRTPQTFTTSTSDRPSQQIEQSGKAEDSVQLNDDDLTSKQMCSPIQHSSICAEPKSQPEETLERPDLEFLRFSSLRSDEEESVSMLDMRCEEEGTMTPHSRAHQEHLQYVNDLLKEEDDTWQNDLARWKTRRRSASQDLIKKEEERKKMEKMLRGEGDLTERRKSIKTYKEIVEEKERRERELHEAYKNAKTKEEADKILQKYIERFTISEAVLERLVMPKILERSHSVEPGLLSSTEDPNPLKYLRQQSLPSPKFTSTVEATISPTSESDFKAPAGRTSPTKSVVSKAVPMLMPKPYSQPRSTQQVLKTFKVDGKINVNGEAVNGTEEQKEQGSIVSPTFASLLTRSQRFEGVARVDPPATELKTDISSIELNLTRTNVHSPDPKVFSEGINHTNQVDEMKSSLTDNVHTEQIKDCTKPPILSREEPAVTNLVSLSVMTTEPTVNGNDLEEEQKDVSKSKVMHWSLDSSKEQNDTALCQDKRKPEDDKDALQKEKHGEPEVSGNPAVFQPLLNSPSRFCAWDPEEERRRQERWQQEQERLLQERYQKEQEKLKEEWEKAQKEVEEEERKYYEEERKIIEDTVLPLTVSPVGSVHHGLSETTGNSVSHQSEPGPAVQGEPWTPDRNHLMDDSHSAKNKVQTSQFLSREGAVHRAAEDQTKRNTTETEASTAEKETDGKPGHPHNASTKLHLPLGMTTESHLSENLNNGVDNNNVQQMTLFLDPKRSDFQDSPRDIGYSLPSPTSQSQSLNRSVSGKKLCSTCGLPLGKGAAMIIETLSLYFHIQCFKCGICKGQLGSATTGTDVRIRNGLLNCNDCYARSRTAGHPTPL